MSSEYILNVVSFQGEAMPESLGFEVDLPFGFDAAIAAARDALKSEGFGVLTEIDMQGAFKEKLGRDFRPYTILGACNPPLAFSALTADPAIGLLLPCNVTVEANGPHQTVIRLADPQVMLSSAPGDLSATLQEIAADAHQRMDRVAKQLRSMAEAKTEEQGALAG